MTTTFRLEMDEGERFPIHVTANADLTGASIAFRMSNGTTTYAAEAGAVTLDDPDAAGRVYGATILAPSTSPGGIAYRAEVAITLAGETAPDVQQGVVNVAARPAKG